MTPLSESALTEMYRTLVETTPVPTVVYREDCMVYANESFLKVWKAGSPSDVIGKSLMDFVPEEMREAVRERTRIICDKEVNLVHVENRVSICDGSPLYVTFCAFPVVVDGERMVGAFVEKWGENPDSTRR